MRRKRASIIFLHFGHQCPWISYMREQARIAARTLGYSYGDYDVTEFPEYAVRFRMFFPFMTVINESLCIPSPITAEQLVHMTSKKTRVSRVSPYPLTKEAEPEKIIPLTHLNVSLTYDLCINKKHCRARGAKAKWIEKISRATKSETIGLIAFVAGKPVAAIEYLPASLIPYDIPDKNPGVMFIDCVYPFRAVSDFRGALIDVAASRLAIAGIKKILVVSGVLSPYPNGPMEFFKRHGFHERSRLGGVILTEGKEELRLMERQL